MARAPRLACMVAALATAGCLLSSTPQAVAEIPAAEPLDGPEAVALALETGEPVVATELTDEHTLVTADPETGLLTAELSAQVARVSDGDGGWREPSATLIAGPDGAQHRPSGSGGWHRRRRQERTGALSRRDPAQPAL